MEPRNPVSHAPAHLEPLEARLLLDGGQDLTIQVDLPLSEGYYYTADGTANVNGLADTATTASVLVKGVESDYSLLDGSWSAGIGGRTLVAADDPASYHVPTAGEDPFAWNALGYDDSLWTSETGEGQAGLLITEVSTGDVRYVELQNVSDAAIETAGWTVLVNDPSGGASGLFATVWNLPASVADGQVLYQTDDGGDQYWGDTIPWDPEGSGWVMVLDDGGAVMDFLAWDYTAAEIASLSVDYGAFTGITVGDGWTGDGAAPGTTGGGPPIPGWVAFNDHVGGAGTHANATTYAANGTASGPLQDIATGSAVPVTLATSGSGIHYGGNGGAAAAGTDAFTVFDGYVDFTTGTEASIEIEAANGDRYTHAFTGLDTGPVVTYNVTGTAVRGEEGDYEDRWTLVTLVGADAATAAHSTGDGVVVVSSTEVAIWTGQNHEADQGFVAAWTAIDPGIDGAFSLISTQYLGATPGVGSGTADGTKGYGLAGIRLEEVGPTGPLSFLMRSGDHDNDGAGDFARGTEGSKGAENPAMTVPFGTITPVAMGLGFSGGHFDEYVHTDVAGDMLDTNASLWTRVAFEAPDMAAYDTLTLRIRYDDGFIAYLNGEKIAEANSPPAPAWNSGATLEHPDGQAVVFQAIDVSTHLADLAVGDNVLAIHGLNLDAGDPDFLVQAELLAASGMAGAGLALQPGINRVLVQALDGTGAEIDRTHADIWYDTGSASDWSGTLPAGVTTWAAADGPYRVTGDLTVAGGSVLVIEPGTTVFFSSGRKITVNGQLDARGTETERIRLTRVPGAGGSWGGLVFDGTLQDSALTYLDMEYGDSGGHSIDIDHGRLRIDNVTWSGTQKTVLELHHPSLIVRNSYLPGISGGEVVHGTQLDGSEYLVFEGNVFGVSTSGGDVVDFMGADRPGPVFQVLNNVFLGGEDDGLDLDGTDAHIEGNLFMNFHLATTRPTTSNAIATGLPQSGASNRTEVTVVRNVFINNDHAILLKEDAFATIVNNLFIGTDLGLIQFFEEGGTSVRGPGRGAYLDGNIVVDTAVPMFKNIDYDPDDPNFVTNLQMHRTLVPVERAGDPVGDRPITIMDLGVGNLAGAPLLADPANGDYHLLPGSPAIGTGPNGVDMGALIPMGATVAGEPPTVTSDTAATLTVGGPDIYGYKYRVEKDGAWLGDWSAEVPHPAPVPPDMIIPPVQPIELTGLDLGTYTVHVVRKDSAGLWQPEDEATRSRSWTVTGPQVTSVELNDRPGRTVGDIEPSGIGVRTVDVTFSEAVTLAAGAVTVETVAFPGGVETLIDTLAPTVEQPAGDAIRIALGDPVGAVDAWVKVTLAASAITDADTNALDGDPAGDSSGMGYIYDAGADLASGDGTPGGDAVFYVGSLRADLRGFGPDAEEPNGSVDSWDINGFTQKYLAGDLDADFRGFGPDAEDPNGNVDSWDINGFTSRYTAALAAGAHLDDLPTSGGGMAAGAPSPLPLMVADAAPRALDGPAETVVSQRSAATPPAETALLAQAAGGPTPAEETGLTAAPLVEKAASAATSAEDVEIGLTVEAALVPAASRAWSPTVSDTAAGAGLAADLLDPLGLPALDVRL